MEKQKGYFFLLQINDSLFPIGAYSHSYGLETYIQKDLVHDTKTAQEYIKKRLEYNFLYTDLLAARMAYEASIEQSLDRMDWLEEVIEASKIPMELREASKKLGNRLVKTLLHMQIHDISSFFELYLARRKGKTTAHPCVYGVICACAGIEKEQALANYLYAQASAMVTTCVKTIPLSQSDGQRILYSLDTFFEEILQQVQQAGEEMLCLSTPGFDLRCIQHEHLYSRLYMS